MLRLSLFSVFAVIEVSSNDDWLRPSEKVIAISLHMLILPSVRPELRLLQYRAAIHHPAWYQNLRVAHSIQLFVHPQKPELDQALSR